MKVQIKKAIKAGNSSAVILPKSWLNKNVRIELIKKTKSTILLETIDILNKYIELNEIIGIYLVGSYARGEEDENSDIDILIITQNIDKEIIQEGIYNLQIISTGLLKQKIDQDLFPIGQMIKEAIPLLNSSFLNSFDIYVTNKNVKWYLETTKDKLEIINEVIDKYRYRNIMHVNDRIAYTLVLRLKTLCIIEKLIKNQRYLKKDFIELIKNITRGMNTYQGYIHIKNNINRKDEIRIEEIERLYKYLKNKLEKVKKIINKKL